MSRALPARVARQRSRSCSARSSAPSASIPVGARTTSFERGDTFAYAVGGGQPAEAVYVEVERTDGGPLEIVQAPIEAQAIPDAPALIGFTVPAAALLDAWGAGAYVMRIYLEPGGEPIAEGRFVLAEAPSSP